jgi:hypothetical protein
VPLARHVNSAVDSGNFASLSINFVNKRSDAVFDSVQRTFHHAAFLSLDARAGFRVTEVDLSRFRLSLMLGKGVALSSNRHFLRLGLTLNFGKPQHKLALLWSDFLLSLFHALLLLDQRGALGVRLPEFLFQFHNFTIGNRRAVMQLFQIPLTDLQTRPHLIHVSLAPPDTIY